MLFPAVDLISSLRFTMDLQACFHQSGLILKTARASVSVRGHSTTQVLHQCVSGSSQESAGPGTAPRYPQLPAGWLRAFPSHRGGMNAAGLHSQDWGSQFFLSLQVVFPPYLCRRIPPPTQASVRRRLLEPLGMGRGNAASGGYAAPGEEMMEEGKEPEGRAR